MGKLDPKSGGKLCFCYVSIFLGAGTTHTIRFLVADDVILFHQLLQSEKDLSIAGMYIQETGLSIAGMYIQSICIHVPESAGFAL